MKKTITNMLATLVVLAVVMIAVPSQAQNFNNRTGGTYNATCNAVIKMKNTASKFESTNPAGAPGNDEGNTLGSGATAIPGIVDWAGATQTVQALRYTNLFISGSGTMTMDDGIIVEGSGTNTGGALCATPAFAGYTDLDGGYPYWVESGTPNYGTGEFTFNGTGDQNIFGATYYDLVLDNTGGKTIESGVTVTSTSITSDANTALDVAGILNLGTGNSTLDGTVSLSDAAAEINVGNGDVDFTNTLTITAGTLAAADGVTGIVSTEDVSLAGTTSVLDFGDGTNLVVSGTMSNNGDGTNLIFSCISTVEFDGPASQPVTPTISSNSYGNLKLTGGNKGVGNAANYVDDIYACGNFDVDGPNLSMLTAADGTSPESGGILFLTDATKTVTYAGNEEVIGSMSRATNASLASYTMNNAATILSLSADANNPTQMQLYVEGDANPVGYEPTSDVQRKVRLDHNSTNPFEFTARVGYLESEGPDAGAGTWPGVYTQNSIRFYEDGSEKVGSGSTPSRFASTGGNLGYVELAGIGYTGTGTVPNGVGVFASGNDLVLRAGPTTFYSVADGRWTNPNTWDEGTQPSAGDDVEIRTVVYVGIESTTNPGFINTAFGTAGEDVAEENTRSEAVHYGVVGGYINPAANNVLIRDDADFANASLIIGNEDNPNSVFTIAGNLTNLNVGDAGDAAFPYAVAKNSAVRENFNGLWLINSLVTDPDGAGALPPYIPAVGMNNIINTGKVNNEGIIELGN